MIFSKNGDIFFRPSLPWSPFCSELLLFPSVQNVHNKVPKKRPGELEQTDGTEGVFLFLLRLGIFA
jgi:hypothetical protein